MLLRALPFLCLRRGVSHLWDALRYALDFSLPTQRCFRSDFSGWRHFCLFSAYAEVFPTAMTFPLSSAAFLCLRRGVSMQLPFILYQQVFSLPTQRCFRVILRGPSGLFLFSAYAEVFLAENSRSRWRSTFLCLRRGVSDQMTRNRKRATFSLPTQRCFRISRPTAPVGGLFSAYAEVFLREAHRRERESSFLCLRRGVSC